MDIQEFDAEMTKHANWFVGEMRKLNDEWESRLGGTLDAGKSAGIPDHILTASANNAVNILEKEAEELKGKE